MLSVTVELVAGFGKIRGKEITFYRGKQPGGVLFHIPLRYKKEHQVTGVTWDERTERSAGKAAAGAIVGGALTGGIGLVAGAALGGRKRDKSTAVISFLDEKGEERRLTVRCDAKKFEGITRYIA
jgi:hypothetical protein